ncbi:unnamed protein product [Alopecurus aequalis]
MAMLRLKWAVMLAVVAVAVGTASGAHRSAPAPVAAAAPAPAATMSPECMQAVRNISDCQSYVESGSTTKNPDKACCPELDGLLQSNPVCICEVVAGGRESLGISIDYNRAMALPGVCKINAPPLSTCAAFGVPGGPSSAPLTGVSPSATGPQIPAATPSTSPSKSAASSGRFTARGLVALAALLTAAAML